MHLIFAKDKPAFIRHVTIEGTNLLGSKKFSNALFGKLRLEIVDKEYGLGFYQMAKFEDKYGLLEVEVKSPKM